MTIGKLVTCGTLNKNFSYIFIPGITVICIQGADSIDSRTVESFLTAGAKIVAEAATFAASTAMIERGLECVFPKKQTRSLLGYRSWLSC